MDNRYDVTSLAGFSVCESEEIPSEVQLEKFSESGLHRHSHSQRT